VIRVSDSPSGTRGNNPDAPGSSSHVTPKPVLDQHWPFPDGEVGLTVAIARPLSAADFASIGAVVAEIEKLVGGLTGRDTDA
jgi:hypothetical protein